jgi:hypothetical protein
MLSEDHNSHFYTLGEYISPETNMILYPLKSSFSHETPFFFELDYLFDGQLRSILAESSEQRVKSSTYTFSTKNYGQNIFLFLLPYQDIKTKMKSLTSLIVTNEKKGTHRLKGLLLKSKEIDSKSLGLDARVEWTTLSLES